MDWACEEHLNAQVARANERKVALKISYKACPVDSRVERKIHIYSVQ